MERQIEVRRLRARDRAAFASALSIATVALVTQALCAPAHAESTSIPPVSQQLEGPQATLEQLARGYRAISPEQVVATYTADYRFHTMGDSLAGFMSGKSRDEEAKLIEYMLHGGGMLPRADSVGMVLNGIREGIDPEHADSAQQYRVLTVGDFQMGVRTVSGTRFEISSREHIFHLVRGDVALLVDGQVADANHWYIRRWIEDVTSIRDLLSGQQGRCGEPEPPRAGPRSQAGGITALAIRPLINPACKNLEVTCALPGREPASVEVFDVSGRLVNRRQVPLAATGEVTIEAGRGATIIPGVYWVRLSQAARKPSTQMVVVAR